MLMARPPLDINTAGKVNSAARVDGRWIPKSRLPEGAKPDLWRAYANFRDTDGATRRIERSGATENKATNNLKTALRDRVGKNVELNATSRFADLAKTWLEGIGRHKSGTTYDRYKTRLDNHVLPVIGQLRCRECTAGRFKTLIDDLERAGLAAATRRGVRTVLSGVMQEAVDRDIITVNPARSMGRIEGGRTKKPSAYDAPQLIDFLARIDGDKESLSANLPDFIRLLFGTGARFGEALALRWRDVNLSDSAPIRATDAWGDTVTVPPKAMWINGNIVDVRGKGLVRNDGKTFKANRVIVLPDYLYTLLLVRRPVGAPEDEPVFPSGTLGWRHPSNVQRSVRRLRLRVKYPHFTTHVGRKSVATALDQAGHSAREIAAILGHAKPSMTQDVYMARGEANPAAAASLDRLHRSG